LIFWEYQVFLRVAQLAFPCDYVFFNEIIFIFLECLMTKGSSQKPAVRKSAVFGGFFLFVIVVSFMMAVVYLEREQPLIDLLEPVSLIGNSKEVNFIVKDGKSGVRAVSVVVRQGKFEKEVFARKIERSGFGPSPGIERLQKKFTIKAKGMGLKDGPAEIIIKARDFSWWGAGRGNLAELVFPVVLDTLPPRVSRMESPRYIKPGGAGIVTYKITEPVKEHGVMVNGHFHPGFPLVGKEEIFAALIGLPHDMAKVNDAHVRVLDEAGNIGKAPFGMILKNVHKKKDRINVSDNFLQLKLPEFTQFHPEMAGSDLEKYIYVNRKVRQANNEKIKDACSSSVPEQLWHGKFGRMGRSVTKAGFAEHRTYYYNDKEVDQQVHLGIDLASVRHAEVRAANRGKVVFADYLGIYGNTVILDHGLGLFSLYSHLSQIGVVAGDLLEKGEMLGATGTSGMAGGDHLHFSILVNGILVDPLEWWDSHWLDINIISYLQ